MAKPNAKKKLKTASKSLKKKKVAPKKAAKPVKKPSAAKKPLKKKVKAKPAPKKKVAKVLKKKVVKAAPKTVAKKPAAKPSKPVAAKPKVSAKAPAPKAAAPVVIHQGLTGAMPLAVVTHYYDKIGVATLKLMGTMRMGDRIRVTRGEVSFEQAVHSLQIGGNPVQGGISGQDVAMKLDQPAHEGARVYKA